jgi:hypothetical protein
MHYQVTAQSAWYRHTKAGFYDFGGKTEGTLTFKPGATVKTISNPIWPDAYGFDSDETYTVTLSAVNGNGTGVTLIRATGTATILGAP